MGKRLDWDEIAAARKLLQEQGRRLVFTNGCFDLLHLGHISYLEEARRQGDALVVAVNTNASVQRSKGPTRPMIPQDERAELLAGLECVDYVTLFDEETPKEVIDAIIPHVLVKGADWPIDQIVGRQTVESNGGMVRNIPLVEGRSTSAIIAKVQSSRPE